MFFRQMPKFENPTGVGCAKFVRRMLVHLKQGQVSILSELLQVLNS